MLLLPLHDGSPLLSTRFCLIRTPLLLFSTGVTQAGSEDQGAVFTSESTFQREEFAPLPQSNNIAMKLKPAGANPNTHLQRASGDFIYPQVSEMT